MSANTSIEWTEATWNPVTGCTKVSPGCDHCYAETFAERFRGTPGHYFEHGFDVQLRPAKLDLPLRWRRPRRIFVNSMSDLFHGEVEDDYIARVFAVMALAQRHTFQVLTKRHGRMRSLLSSEAFVDDIADRILERADLAWAPIELRERWWPLPNVWLGVSAEDQRWADIRIPALLATPAAVRWVSAEPLLGPIDAALYLDPSRGVESRGKAIDWVVVGGESGRGARPMHPDWARSLREQCKATGVPFLFKQRGEWTWNEPGYFQVPTKPYSDRAAVMHGAGMVAMTRSNPFDPFAVGHPFWTTRIDRVGKKAAGRELDGVTHDGYPTPPPSPAPLDAAIERHPAGSRIPDHLTGSDRRGGGDPMADYRWLKGEL